MRTVLFGAIVASFSLPALAAHAPAAPKPICQDFAGLKAEFAKDPELKSATFTPLTVGQLHFIEGVYAASPITPSGMPPGDGAQIMRVHGKSSLLWTRGKQACMTVIVVGQGDDGRAHGTYMPMPLSDPILRMLRSVKTGIDETTVDTSKDL